MKEVNYKFVDGTTKSIQVNDEFYKSYEEMETQTKRLERKETRRQTPLSFFEEQGIEFADDSIDIDEILENSELTNKIQLAISQLTKKQQDLIKQVFYLNKSLSEVAKEKGISKSAVTQQMKTIYKNLKEIVKNF